MQYPNFWGFIILIIVITFIIYMVNLIHDWAKSKWDEQGLSNDRHESSGTPGKPGQLKVVSGTRRDR
jgi:hypothetical protein